ncbi:MAG: leucine-rich repeat domain-containing protein, partial [Muribaculaceae bacterium]
MRRLFNSYVMTMLAMVLGFGFTAKAQSSNEPAIVIHTNAYANDGEINEFTLMIGANTAGQYVDVDCGFGKVEYELLLAAYDSENAGLQGTAIPCKVSPEGIVKIYCDDPGVIDYFNGDGCSITQIDFASCPNLGVLSLNHNELKSLDLTPNTNLKAIYISDNEFTEATPLVIGANKPNLTILELSIIKYMDPNFNISDYPNLMSVDFYHNEGITSLDPTGCPKLLRISADLTHIQSIDVSQNPELLILNVSDTGVKELDLSNNTKLQQLYCSHESGSFYGDVKINTLDLSHNPDLVYLFCSSNNLTSLDVTGCANLEKIYAYNNYLTSLDLTQNPSLWTVKIQKNCMDFATLPFDPGTWDEYEYDQRPMPVAKSYPVDAQIDLSSRVIRDDLPTYCALYSVSADNPTAYTALDESYYSYDNGVITLKQEVPDSLMLSFTNDEFPNIALVTTKFMVKSASEYGKPSQRISFSPAATPGATI